MKSILLIFVRPLLQMICRVFYRVQIVGDMSGFKADKLLIISNHESLLDGLLLGLFLPVHPVFVVYSGLMRSRLFRFILFFSDYLTVDPTNPMTMKTVLRLVESGRPVVIFPEGRITLTGSLMKVYEGPAFVASKTGATVVAVRLDGAKYSHFAKLGGNHPRLWFPKITLYVLPPKKLETQLTGSAQDKRRQLGMAMHRLLEEMLYVSVPAQTLFSAFCSGLTLYGRSRKILEDIKQIEYSYQDLLKMALMLGRLVAKVTEVRENVGIMLPNLAPTAAIILGLSAQGRVAAMLNYTIGADGLQSACAAAQIKTIVSSRAFIAQAKFEGKLQKLSELTNIKIIYLEDLKSTINFIDKLWLITYALWFAAQIEINKDPEQIAVILFTSGSEGKPKGVALSHRAIMANIAQIRAVFAFSVNDKFFNALPMFHSLGLTAGTLLPLLSGTSLFLYPTPLHYRIIPELIYDRNCTVLFGTSTFLNNYAKHAHPYDFYSLRYVLAGAEKLSPAVRQLWFDKFGLRIFEGYGATEASPVIAVNTPMANRQDTVGKILPGMEARVQAIAGISDGGMLHVRGANLLSGYLLADTPGILRPAQSEFGNGWYETGDVVKIDNDGFVSIVGRVKRFAKIAGEMVSLENVEKLATLATNDQAIHAATSIADEKRGEAIILFTTNANLNKEAMIKAASEQGFSELSIPRKIIIVENLPLLATGKTDYVNLKKLAENEN